MGEYSKRIAATAGLLAAVLQWGAADLARAEDPALTERDYLADVAPVLSVTV